MPALINLENINLSFTTQPLLDQVNLQIQSGERVCLIGRNGAGKSSLLKIIEGSIEADSGNIHRDAGITIARLAQEHPEQNQQTVYQFIEQAFQDGAVESWQAEQWIKEIIMHLDLDGAQKVADLSGGWQRRVALARALVKQPDLLLLDEPTNHLDIAAIQWLENQLLKFKGGILFITHDRWLLKRLATRIIELDRGQLTSWPGDYDNFLRRKEEMLATEEQHNKEFDKRLAQEERWIRQGIKARRTRNEGRVRALKRMREERKQRRTVQGTAKLELNQANISGGLVVEATRVSHSFTDNKVINDFSMRIMRGDRIGLLGPNGIGKSTLLNILLGNLTPNKGEIKLGTKLNVAYFDQSRAVLDPEKSILDNVAGGRSSVTINGKEKHMIGYLADFLFPADRIHTPVKLLSGGECNRLLLAKLFSAPANVLVMDEPTNDLDIETLELLEELLSQFEGTLLLVSHDRAFLDNIVTHTLVFTGDGQIVQHVGGYQDWLEQAKQTAPTTEKTPTSNQPPKQATLDKQARKELSALPRKLEKLEQTKQKLFDQMAEPGFYDQPQDKVNHVTEQLKQTEDAIEQAYARWDVLENQINGNA